MKFDKINPDMIRVVGPNDMLIGLITKHQDNRRWRVELFMCIDGVADTQAEAVAFARGCQAMADARQAMTQRVGPSTPAPPSTQRVKS